MSANSVSQQDMNLLNRLLPTNNNNRVDDFSDMFGDKNSHVFRCARDLSAWVGYLLDSLSVTRENDAYNLTALNRGFAGVVNGLYGINIIPDMNKMYHASSALVNRVIHYRDGTENETGGWDVSGAFRKLTNAVCSFISDTCAFTKWVISIDALPAAVPYSNPLSIAKNTACIIRSVDNTVTHGSSGYNYATSEQSLSAIEEQEYSRAKWEVVKEVGSVAINTLGLIGIVTSITIASPVFLTISSVILLASTMIYFIKKDTARMESNELIERLSARTISVV